jgi:RNA polymerase sigma-54 factor
VVQRLDPCGVGARDLRECLLLQLGEGDEIEHRIVRRCLPDFLENRLPRIATTLEMSLDDVNEGVALLRTLDPQPGRRFEPGDPQQIRPEIFVDEIDGRYTVRIEEGSVPRMRVSPDCATLLQEGAQNPQVLDYVRKKMESARWLLHAVEQRNRTIRDIAQAIVDHQHQFFRRGPGHLEALTMQTIADLVGVHISTVSRAANGKYIETPYGSMELRRFFTGGVERADGGIESRDNVCGVIREIVSDEDARRPLSDSQLTRRLQERGIDIARRTVSKYRERAGIPQARLRKRY